MPNGVSRSIQGRTFWWTLNILPISVNLAHRISPAKRLCRLFLDHRRRTRKRRRRALVLPVEYWRIIGGLRPVRVAKCCGAI